MSINESTPSARLTRRSTLKGAAVAVGTLWVAPVVQVVSMESASAASAPPQRVQGPPISQAPPVSEVVPPVSQVEAATATQGQVEAATATQSQVSATQAQAAGQLPRTGSSTPVGELLAGGAGAIVLGAGAVALARKRVRQSATPTGDEPAEA